MTLKTLESLKTKDKALDLIRTRLLIETQAEHFLAVLEKGTVSTNAYQRETHNFAIDMNWLSKPKPNFVRCAYGIDSTGNGGAFRHLSVTAHRFTGVTDLPNLRLRTLPSAKP
jgi:hypothetical protein